MNTSQAITDFQFSCQKYLVCFTFAESGLREFSRDLASKAPDLNANFFVGTGHPNLGRVHAAIRIGEAIESSKTNGVFSDKIAKSFVTAMYSEWDEVYRPRLASEVGVDPKFVKCDLMGDIRLIRHCIVHNKSIIENKHTKLRELKWQLSPGELLVSKEMLSMLIDQINAMVVRVEPPPLQTPNPARKE